MTAYTARISVTELTSKVNHLRDDLRTTESALEDALKLRRDDPVDYIGRHIYANKTATGSYGYEYGDYGDAERKRAQEVIDAAGGDLTIAERFVTEFHIR